MLVERRAADVRAVMHGADLDKESGTDGTVRRCVEGIGCTVDAMFVIQRASAPGHAVLALWMANAHRVVEEIVNVNGGFVLCG